MKQQFTVNIFLYHTILTGISARKGLCRLIEPVIILSMIVFTASFILVFISMVNRSDISGLEIDASFSVLKRMFALLYVISHTVCFVSYYSNAVMA
jgi:hypothetical protein